MSATGLSSSTVHLLAFFVKHPSSGYDKSDSYPLVANGKIVWCCETAAKSIQKRGWGGWVSKMLEFIKGHCCSYSISYRQSALVSFNHNLGCLLTISEWLLLQPPWQRFPDIKEVVVLTWNTVFLILTKLVLWLRLTKLYGCKIRKHIKNVSFWRALTNDIFCHLIWRALVCPSSEAMETPWINRTERNRTVTPDYSCKTKCLFLALIEIHRKQSLVWWQQRDGNW